MRLGVRVARESTRRLIGWVGRPERKTYQLAVHIFVPVIQAEVIALSDGLVDLL